MSPSAWSLQSMAACRHRLELLQQSFRRRARRFNTHRLGSRRPVGAFVLGIEALEPRRQLAIGDLDLAFGTGGQTLADFGTSDIVSTRVNASAIQLDGKLVVVGEGAIARLQPDGELDSSFGRDGTLDYPFFARAVAVQPNGAILIAGGTRATASEQFVISRYTPSGLLDTSFDGDGHVLVDFGTETEFASSIAIQPNGQIVVAGVSDRSIAIGRLLPNGSLDSSFDQDGKLTQQFYTTANSASAVAVQPDGKILVAGTAWQYSATASNHDAFVMRLNSSGSLDRTFNATGVTFINRGRYDDAKAMSLLGDGRIVVSGYANVQFSTNLLVARLNANGSFDNTFDLDGVRVEPISGFVNSFTGGEAHVVQADGSIVVSAGGRLLTFDASGNHPANGFTNVFGFQSIAAMRLSPSQQLVISGTAYSRYAVAILNPDKSYDTTFSGDGIRLLTIGASDDQTGRGAVQADGKLVIAGTSNHTFSVLRLLPTGLPDPAFARDGKAVIDLGPMSLTARATAVAVQADGKLVIVGEVNQIGQTVGGLQTETHMAMVRLNSDGSLDRSFGLDGVVVTKLGGFSQANVVKLQADGRIVVGGLGAGGFFTVLRYLPTGQLDRAFSGDGIFTLVGTNQASSSALDLDIQADGKLVVVGEQLPQVSSVFPSNYVILRLNVDGSLDRSFGTNGRIVGSSPLRSASRIAIDKDGSLVVGGNSIRFQNNQFDSQIVLSRYGATGGLLWQQSIPRYEIPTLAFPSQTFPIPTRLTAMTLQADGKIVVTADAGQTSILYRFNRDGTEDSSLSGDGNRQIVSADRGAYQSTDVLVPSSTRLVLVGSLRAPQAAHRNALVSRVIGGSQTVPSTIIRLNATGQLEVRDQWSRDDDLVIEQQSSWLVLTDRSRDTNAVFSVDATLTLEGTGTKQIRIPIALLNQTNKPLLVNTLGGDDSLELRHQADDDTKLSISFAAGAGNDQIINDSLLRNGLWQVNYRGSGTLTPAGLAAREFSAVERFVGGLATDDFRLSAGTTTSLLEFYGGSGIADSLSIIGDTDMRVMQNQIDVTGRLNQRLWFSQFEQLTMTGGRSSNLLDARNFAGTTLLQGGAGDDWLFAGQGAAVLSGGAGNDRLFGSSGDDVLYGDQGNDLLSGDSGNDRLFGGTGNDVLVGGFGTDTLFGGPGENILIGGLAIGLSATSDPVQLSALLTGWFDTSSTFTQRIEILRDIGVGPGQSRLRANVEVFDDTNQDTLLGGLGLDWFFAKLAAEGQRDLLQPGPADVVSELF